MYPQLKKYTTLLLGCGCLFLLARCKKADNPDTKPLQAAAGKTGNTIQDDTWTPWVMISNTTDKTLELYNYNSSTWDASTRSWQFKPTTTLGYSSGAVTALGAGVGDVRVHYTSGFPDKAQSAFAFQGGRLIAIGANMPLGSYIKGQKLWEYTFPSTQNPNNHAIELLPNGNMVVAGFGDGTAASTYGNWVRVYNTADATGSSYAQANLIGPHALLYDTIYHRLWVGGQILIGGLAYHGLFAYIVGGTRTNPTITEDVNLRAVLRYGNPTDPNAAADHLKFPHDIAADYDNDDLLIYGDHTGVYNFNKVTKKFMPTPGSSHLYSGTDVLLKSVGKMQNKYYISTQAYNPSYPYYTNKVDFFDPVTGNLAFSRSVSGFTIYRARLWTNAYQ